jgi:hypothetical protein
MSLKLIQVDTSPALSSHRAGPRVPLDADHSLQLLDSGTFPAVETRGMIIDHSDPFNPTAGTELLFDFPSVTKFASACGLPGGRIVAGVVGLEAKLVCRSFSWSGTTLTALDSTDVEITGLFGHRPLFAPLGSDQFVVFRANSNSDASTAKARYAVHGISGSGIGSQVDSADLSAFDVEATFFPYGGFSAIRRAWALDGTRVLLLGRKSLKAQIVDFAGPTVGTALTLPALTAFLNGTEPVDLGSGSFLAFINRNTGGDDFVEARDWSISGTTITESNTRTIPQLTEVTRATLPVGETAPIFLGGVDAGSRAFQDDVVGPLNSTIFDGADAWGESDENRSEGNWHRWVPVGATGDRLFLGDSISEGVYVLIKIGLGGGWSVGFIRIA